MHPCTCGRMWETDWTRHLHTCPCHPSNAKPLNVGDGISDEAFSMQLDTTRNNLETIIKMTEAGDAWTIVRGNKPVAVIIGVEEYEELKRLTS